MKPIAILLTIAVPVAIAAAALALNAGFGWLGAMGFAYGSLALVEVAYLGVALSRGGGQARAFQPLAQTVAVSPRERA